MLYGIAKPIAVALMRSIWNLEVRGREHVPALGPLLVVSNHVSVLDPPFVGGACPRELYYLAKEELFAVPLFDGGFRAGEKAQRLADLSSIKFQRTNAERGAASEIRSARASVASTTRAFNAAQQAADRANQVVMITDVAFREGASTNIEVLDAQRQARDVETQAAIAEDALKRAQLDLLVALGRFPQ